MGRARERLLAGMGMSIGRSNRWVDGGIVPSTFDNTLRELLSNVKGKVFDFYRRKSAVRVVRGAAGWSASGKWAGKAMVTLVPRPGRLVTSNSAASP